MALALALVALMALMALALAQVAPAQHILTLALTLALALKSFSCGPLPSGHVCSHFLILGCSDSCPLSFCIPFHSLFCNPDHFSLDPCASFQTYTSFQTLLLQCHLPSSSILSLTIISTTLDTLLRFNIILFSNRFSRNFALPGFQFKSITLASEWFPTTSHHRNNLTGLLRSLSVC